MLSDMICFLALTWLGHLCGLEHAGHLHVAVSGTCASVRAHVWAASRSLLHAQEGVECLWRMLYHTDRACGLRVPTEARHTVGQDVVSSFGALFVSWRAQGAAC